MVWVQGAACGGAERLAELLSGDLVDLLNGSPSSAVLRQNRKDDGHLRLLLRFSLRSTSNFLDVGANQGKFLRGLQQLAPLGHHIAYEPLPNLSAKLAAPVPGDRDSASSLVGQKRVEFRSFTYYVQGFRATATSRRAGWARGGRRPLRLRPMNFRRKPSW